MSVDHIRTLFRADQKVVTKAYLPSRSNSRPAVNKLARFDARILHTKQHPASSGFGSSVPFDYSASRDVLVHRSASYAICGRAADQQFFFGYEAAAVQHWGPSGVIVGGSPRGALS